MRSPISLAVAFPAAPVTERRGSGRYVGLVLGRYRFRGRALTNFVIFLATRYAGVVLGSSLLAIFVQLGSSKPLGLYIPLGYWSILVSHIAFSIASSRSRCGRACNGSTSPWRTPPRILFANPRVAFFRVTLPIILPGIVAGFLLALVLSLDDFVITNFVKGSSSTFPTWVFGATRLGVPPQVNVWGTVLFLAGVFAAGLQILRARGAETEPRR